MSIHTIGDSHSYFGWSNNIINHHIGAVLCYSFSQKKLDLCDIREYNIKDGDTIVFCFGEIDCRCHIKKHITNDKTYEDIIDDIINNYFETIKLHIEISNIKFKNICVYNVVPPVMKKTTSENLLYPFLGSDEERKNYVLYFNKKLNEKCIEKKYIFFNIYDEYKDINGFLRKDLSDGNVHIKNGIYISNFINQNNI